MQLYELQFENRTTLLCAFGRAQDRPAIDSCMLELDALRLRLVAPRDDAEEFAHQVYEDGGLRWCSGHQLGS